MFQLDIHHPIHIHFIGIGGISMSALAHILLDRKFSISGSDLRQSELTDQLEALGADIRIGHRKANITDDIDLIVYTAAIHSENEELSEAAARKIPMLTRAEAWGQLMKNYHKSVAVSGTHGKTTTTSMLTELYVRAGLDPTVSIGGLLPSIGGNLRIGGHELFLTEACEYTNSFLNFYPTIEIILNIEEDHLDFFKDLDDIRHSFKKFTENLPADGLLILNGSIPHPEYLTDALPCRLVTFGLAPDDTYTAKNVVYDAGGCASYDLYIAQSFAGRISLRVPGEHNLLNSLAAVAAACALDIPFDCIRDALAAFCGTHRRFERKGELGGISIYDDYAHHPTEIASTIATARKLHPDRLVVVFQPHTYTRTKAFLKDFAAALGKADLVVLTDIYAAREINTTGISSKDLQAAIQALGTTCKYFSSFSDVEKFLLENSIHGDMLITMGAGDVVNIGEHLLGK